MRAFYQTNKQYFPFALVSFVPHKFIIRAFGLQHNSINHKIAELNNVRKTFYAIHQFRWNVFKQIKIVFQFKFLIRIFRGFFYCRLVFSSFSLKRCSINWFRNCHCRFPWIGSTFHAWFCLFSLSTIDMNLRQAHGDAAEQSKIKQQQTIDLCMCFFLWCSIFCLTRDAYSCLAQTH